VQTSYSLTGASLLGTALILVSWGTAYGIAYLSTHAALWTIFLSILGMLVVVSVVGIVIWVFRDDRLRARFSQSTQEHA